MINLVIGIIIGLLAGTFLGMILTSLMAAASREDRYREALNKDTKESTDVANNSDTWAKEYFKGKCPYTSQDCDKWNCKSCEVEAEELADLERLVADERR